MFSEIFNLFSCVRSWDIGLLSHVIDVVHHIKMENSLFWIKIVLDFVMAQNFTCMLISLWETTSAIVFKYMTSWRSFLKTCRQFQNSQYFQTYEFLCLFISIYRRYCSCSGIPENFQSFPLPDFEVLTSSYWKYSQKRSQYKQKNSLFE